MDPEPMTSKDVDAHPSNNLNLAEEAFRGNDFINRRNILRERHSCSSNRLSFHVLQEHFRKRSVSQRQQDEKLDSLRWQPYVDVEVMGLPVKALVDSGTQSTMMSRSSAERCGLLREPFHRSCIAYLFGQSKNLDLIDSVPVKIGSSVYQFTFLVPESNDFKEIVFGFDMLCRHRCKVDLGANFLGVGDGEVLVSLVRGDTCCGVTQQQQLFYRERETKNSDKSSASGVKDENLATTVSSAASASASSISTIDLIFTRDESAAGAFYTRIQHYSNLMTQLFQCDHAAGEEILKDNLNELLDVLRELQMEVKGVPLQASSESDAQSTIISKSCAEQHGSSTNDLSFSPEVSTVKRGAYRQHIQVYSNLMTQLFETDPGSALMVLANDLNKLQDLLRWQPYIDVGVMGVRVKARVATGAQLTIMSKSCAERCGVMEKLNTEYDDIDIGDGQLKVYGVLYDHGVKVGKVFFWFSLLVVESCGSDEIVIGLDMLRGLRHGMIKCATIDLKEKGLIVGDGREFVQLSQGKDIHLGKELYKRAKPDPDAVFEAKVEEIVSLGVKFEDAVRALKLANDDEYGAIRLLIR